MLIVNAESFDVGSDGEVNLMGWFSDLFSFDQVGKDNRNSHNVLRNTKSKTEGIERNAHQLILRQEQQRQQSDEQLRREQDQAQLRRQIDEERRIDDEIRARREY